MANNNTLKPAAAEEEVIFDGPLQLVDRVSDDGGIYYNIVDANNRPILPVTERHEAAARELVRLSNLGMGAE